MREAVVIGAGAVGAATAIELLRDGWSVTILDPGEPGGPQAASYGNGAWLSPMSVIAPSTPGLWRKLPKMLMDPLGALAVRWRYLPRAAPWLARFLAAGWTEARVRRTAGPLRALLRDSPALHGVLALEAGVPELIAHDGIMYVYPERAAFDAEAMAWRIRRQLGIDWVELSGAGLHRQEPALGPRYGFGALVAEGGHCHDPGAYVAALAAHAGSLGAVLRRDGATGFRVADGRLRAVLTGSGEIAAEAAAVCAGAWSKTLARGLGDRVPLDTERGYHAVLANPGITPRTPLMPSDGKMGITLTPAGLRASGQVEIAGLHAAPDWRRADILRDYLLGVFPDLPRDTAVEHWMGFRPSMPDGLPCIGPARSTPDVVYAFGHGHVGLAGAARTARLVAQCLGGRPAEIDIAPFSPRRFRSWRPASWT